MINFHNRNHFQHLINSLEDKPIEMWTYRRFLKELSSYRSVNIIGESEKGTPIYGFEFGNGPKIISVMAGAHADEPAGPNTLYRLVLDMLISANHYSDLLSRYRFLVIPHINPDGDEANSTWISKWPDPVAFMTDTIREPPGRDIEFGYPEMRVENSAAIHFWEHYDPVDIHFSLHGMQFSEGYLLLINDEWEKRTIKWRKEYDRLMHEEGLAPHDHNRFGEKGFNYFGPGFTSTPKGKAMQHFFRDKGDLETAEKFHNSSMEYQQERNSDVLCMVTELPLFTIANSVSVGKPENYLKLKNEWGLYRAKNETSEKIEVDEWKRMQLDYDIKPLSLNKAIRLQLMTIQSALELI